MATTAQTALQQQNTPDLPPAHAISRRPYRVVVHGLRHFCQKLPGLLNSERWDIRDRSLHTPSQLANLVRDLRSCDLVFTWAGRIDMGPFLWGARSLGANRIVIFWCGSDVLRAHKYFAAGKINPWIAERIHWAASPSLAEEVRSMGFPCEFVQASFVGQVAQPKPLPKKFSVLVFVPTADRADLYGYDHIVSVANALPDMHFNLVGLHKGQSLDAPPNVTVHPWTADLAPAYEQTTVLWRPVRHDAGISFMVLEALAHGRHVLYSYPVPGAVQVQGIDDAMRHLEHLHDLHHAGLLPLNHAGRAAVARSYTREVVRDELHRRWENIILS
jgi:hypothetical protein